MIYRDLHASIMRYCGEFCTKFTDGVVPTFTNFDATWEETDLPENDLVGYHALTFSINDGIIDGSFQVGYSTQDDLNLFRLIKAMDLMVDTLKPLDKIPVYDADSGELKGAIICKNGTRLFPVIGTKNRPVQFIGVQFSTTTTYKLTADTWLP